MEATPGHDLGVAATRFHRAMKRNVAATLAPIGLSGSEYGALDYLVRHAEPSNSQLAEYLMVTPQALGRLTARLAGNGLIERNQVAQAHRYALRLTERGLALLESVRSEVEAAQQQLLAPLGEAEREIFARALTVCADNYDRHEGQT